MHHPTTLLEITSKDSALEAWLPKNSQLLVVTDPDCLADAKPHLAHIRRFTPTTLITLPASPKADMATAQTVQKALEGKDYALAIGSGTISDLVKYASYRAGVPYAVLPTAPSMNGYLSANASLDKDGIKQSFPATTPRHVLLDWGIIQQAPKRMIASGFADALCRSTCWRDAMLARHLLEVPMDDAIMQRLHQCEQATLAEEAGLMRRSLAAIKPLMLWLLEGGRAMTEAGSSAPASQGEHMLAHWMELRGFSKGFLHGEVIAVTTLMMARLQEELLQLPPAALEWQPPPIDAMHHLLGQKLAISCLDSAAKKPIATRQKARAWLKKWPEAAAHLAASSPSHCLTSTELEHLLKRQNLPTTAKDLHWPARENNLALKLTAYSRDRFTFLDIGALRRPS